MKAMIKKTLALAAAVCGLHAFAATPVAVWDGDFTTATKNGWTLSSTGSTITDASITIGTTPITIKNASDVNTGWYTVVYKVKGLVSTSTTPLATWGRNTTDSGYDNANILGALAKTDTPWGIWNGAERTDAPATQQAMNLGTDATVEHRIVVRYHSGVASGVWAFVDGTKCFVADSKLKASITKVNRFTILGYFDKSNDVLAGATVTGVAIFSDTSDAGDAAYTGYKFPTELVGTMAGTINTVTSWNKDFANNYNKGGYTVSFGAGATLNDDGTVSLAQQGTTGTRTDGVVVDFCNGGDTSVLSGSQMTVIVKYSGLQYSTDARTVLFSTKWGTDSKDTTEVVIVRTLDGNLAMGYGITAGGDWANEQMCSAATFPTAGLMMISCSGNGGCLGTRVGFAPLLNDGTYGDFVDAGFKSNVTYSNKPFYGIKIGGTQGGISTMTRPGMKVEGVAVVKGVTSTMKTFKYCFPDECFHIVNYSGSNPTAETKLLNGVSLKTLTNAVYAAQIGSKNMTWTGCLLTACQKKFTTSGDAVTQMEIQYQHLESDYAKAANLTYYDRADGIYFKRTSGHYGNTSKIGTDDATWTNHKGAYNVENLSIYAPVTKTATVSGNVNWGDIWGGAVPTADDFVSIKVTANATLTVNSTSAFAAAKVISAAGAALTIKYAGVPECANWNFCHALGGVSFDLSAIPGADLTKYAVAGAPYSLWLVRGAYDGLAVPTVTLPTAPTGYTFAVETTDAYGVRVIVTAPNTVKYGAVSLNISNGHDLADGNHGAYPVAKASWGNMTSGTAPRETTVDGVTFTLSGKTGTFYQNGTNGKLLYDYVDDANGNYNEMTISNIAYSKYRIIVYFNSDGSNSKFCPMYVNGVPYSAMYTDGTASTTVKGSSAYWGKNGNTAKDPIEGYNYIVSDVLTGSSATVKITSARSTARGTPAAYQIVKVDPVAKIGDNAYDTLAAAENAVSSGQTITLLRSTDEALATAKTFTFALNGCAYGGELTVNDGADLTLSGVTTSTLAGSISIAEGGVVTAAEEITRDMNRALLNKTSGAGTLKITVNKEIEVHSSSDSAALVANVNVDYLGTGELKYVGSMRDVDKFTVPAGKTVTFNGGMIWPMRAELVVNGTVLAKDFCIGHNSAGNYPGKLTINDGGFVKTEAMIFRNAGGKDVEANRSVLDVKTGGVLEFTQNDAVAIEKRADGVKNCVKLDGGTFRAVTSSWFTDAGLNSEAVSGTTTTLSAAEGKTIDFKGAITGTGAIAVPGPGTVILGGATRPATTPIVGTSAGTIGFVLTDDEKTALEDGGSVSPFTFTGDAFAGKVKAFETSGTEYAITFAASEGTITVQKKKDAKVSPFNLTTAYSGDWTAAAWKDSKTPTAQDVISDDWDLKVDATMMLPVESTTSLTADRSIAIAHFAITNAGTLAISTNATCAITVDAIDDSASTGTTTIGFDTGSAPITAGANTILNGTGTGKITMAANTKVTVGNNHFGGDFTVTGGTQIYAPDATSEIVFDLGEGNAQGILGNTDINNSRFAMTVTSGILDFKTPCNGNGYGVFNKRTMTADGANAILRLSADDATGWKGGGVAINLKNGGALELANRDTMKLPVNLTGGTIKLLTGCAKGDRALDLFGNNDWHAIGATGATAQNPTVSVLTFEEGAADDDKKVLIRDTAWNIDVDATAQFDVYATIIKNTVGAGGTPGKLVKTGPGRLTLKAANTYDKGTTLSAGTLTIENAAALGEGAIEMASGATLELNIPGDATFATVCSGAGRIRKVGTGTTTITGANTYEGGTTVNAGKLVADGNFNGTYEINANGAAEFTVDTTVDGYATPTVTTLNGTLVLKAKTTTTKAMSGASFAIATLPADVDPAKVTATLIDKESGATIATDVTIDPTTGAVTVKVHIEDYTLTPSASGDFTWAVGEAGSSFDASKKWTDFGNVGFKTTEYTTAVTNPALVKASNVQLGGTYSFDGSPMVASKLATAEGAVASFANDAVATDAAITNGAVAFASLTANDVVVSNATFDAKVLGPSMKFVRLKITQTSGGASDNRPAVGEFRLYRGSATTGYTIVDWPVGTKVSDSTGLVATKETADYPAEVGAGLGKVGGNEGQPGDLIDGYFGNHSSPKIYGTGVYNTPAYNKWWPDTQKDGGPWIVTIEFPYPVATFSGCNFCLADHEPRNPTAWTIEVSDDGETWVEVNNTTGATWGAQYDWAGEGENVPAFLNKGTTPTEVNVQNGATVVADGSWTAALNASGNITFLGVAGKNLTLDAASTSSFAKGAKLTFDLNAYDVSAAGKQYVVAGPTEGWPEVKDITVEPKTFSLYKDAEGYYVVVESGNYWVGDQEGGVGTWDFRNTKAWATNATETTKKDVWLNDVPAFFTRNATVTIADDQDLQPTAINVTSNDDIAVTFTGDLSMFATLPINIGSTNVTVTVENDEALMFGSAMTAVAGSAPKFVKKGTGDLTLNTAAFTSVTAEAGTLKQGFAECFGADAMITASGSGVLDLDGYRPRAIVTLGAGGTLVNNRASLAYNVEQCTNIVLTGNATVGGTKDFGLLAHSYTETSLKLNGNTLTKTGANNFWLCNTTITGAGTIQIDDGTLAVDSKTAKDVTFADGTISIGAAGTLRVAANRTLTVGAIAGAEGGTLNNAGTISAFTLTGVLTVGNTGTYGTITLSSAVLDIGPRRGLTLAGAGSVKAQLTAAYEPGEKVTLFMAAQDSDIALTELKDASGEVIDSSRYTFANGEVTFRKEAKIGTTYYIVLADAVSAAKDGDVVELLADANVGTTAIPVAGNIALAGDSFAVTGAGFSIDAEKTLTISNGFFGVSTDVGSGTLQLKGGRYTAACKTAWAEGKVPSGYVFAELAVPVGDYAWQVLASAEPIPDTKAVVPVANPDGTDAGSMVLDKEWVAEKGSGNTVEEKVADLNTPQSNGQTKLTNEILGLDGAVAESKPVPAPQQVADANHLAFKLGGCDVDTDSGATVTFKVLSADTPGASSWTAASDETAYDGTATVALPDSGVKYYKFEVVTLTSK